MDPAEPALRVGVEGLTRGNGEYSTTADKKTDIF
jgi:hypothetical protein